MAIHQEKSTLPPSQMRGANEPDIDAIARENRRAQEAVERSVREAATTAMQAVRAYSATKAVR